MAPVHTNKIGLISSSLSCPLAGALWTGNGPDLSEDVHCSSQPPGKLQYQGIQISVMSTENRI